jgi:hypothetical protein
MPPVVSPQAPGWKQEVRPDEKKPEGGENQG